MVTSVHRVSLAILCICISAVSAAVCTSCKKKQHDKGPKTYTYRLSGTAPQSWSPTDWQMNNESVILSFTQSGLYEFVLNKTRDNSEVICEMASSFPQDVTSSYAGDRSYGIPSGAKTGYAWKIDLNPLACWEDGTPINADSWIYSAQQFLNPKMKNYRASSLYEGNFSIYNAREYYEGTITDWSRIGIIRNNDYSLTFILSKPTTPFFIEYSIGSLSLLKKDLYEANKKETGGLVKSSYGTAPDNYMSYGPYKIISYQPEKEMIFGRNEKWYGYTDGKHDGLYMTTNIDIEYVDKYSTILSLFLQGKLDETSVSSENITKYGNSDYIYYTPQSYTYKITINSDFAALKSEETDGTNHTMLAYRDFRHAVSLSLDRQAFTKTVSPASSAGYALFNYSYISDPETGEKFRDCPQAVNALCRFYGTDTIEDITGYDKETAAELFTRAYNKALRDGTISKTDTITVNFLTYDAGPGAIRYLSFIQDAVNAATSGTDLSGRIVFRQVTDENANNNIKRGRGDMTITAWGGGTYDPYSSLWCYSVPGVFMEYGFNPDRERLTIAVHGTNVTKSYHEWYNALCMGEYSDADKDTRNLILAENEVGLLSYYTMIPLFYLNSASLDSQRIIEGSEKYIDSNVGRGGVREMQYSMDDASWDAYCEDNNNQLTY